MKKFAIVVMSLVLAFGVYLSMGTVDNSIVSAPEADAGKSFSGDVYVAGHGGHFAKVDLSVSSSGLKVKGLDIVSIGESTGPGPGKTYWTHDARIDNNDSTKMFWSTYKLDDTNKKNKKSFAHVGLTDLTTGKVLMDKLTSIDSQGSLFCGSGQTKKSYIPMTMTKNAYIDVYDKATLTRQHRIPVEKLGFDQNYVFIHGNSSPDMKTLMVTVNGSKKWSKTDGGANVKELNGKIHNFLLDSAALEKGKVVIKAQGTVSGESKIGAKGGTITFRQSFTPDGKKIVQSGRDRVYVLDATSKKLKAIKKTMMPAGIENHDAVAGPNGRYAILTLRTDVKNAEGKKVKDGALQLYDIKKGKLVGKPVSVCNACHKDQLGDKIKAVLCGADVNWK